MKNLKFLGLAVVTAMALMALAASSASATVLYKGSTPMKNGETIDFSLPSGGSGLLVDTSGELLDTCTNTTIKGSITIQVTIPISILSQSNCTFPTTTNVLGKLEVVSTGGTNGNVKADAEIGVTINTVFFGSCVYGVASGTQVGTLAGNPATFTAGAVAKKLSGSNIACPETAKWTGTYKATEPAELHVEEK